MGKGNGSTRGGSAGSPRGLSANALNGARPVFDIETNEATLSERADYADTEEVFAFSNIDKAPLKRNANNTYTINAGEYGSITIEQGGIAPTARGILTGNGEESQTFIVREGGYQVDTSRTLAGAERLARKHLKEEARRRINIKYGFGPNGEQY